MLVAVGFLFAWTVLTHLSLLLFQQSLAKAKIRSVHVARCVRYAFDIGIWFAALGIASVALEFFWSTGDSGLFLTLFSGPLLLLAIYRLWRAYRLYLNFDHAFWVVLSSQFITLTIIAIVLANAYHKLSW